MSDAVHAMPNGSTSEEVAWAELERELAAWRDAGRQATFWWRDDDASRHGPKLTGLLELSGSTDVPVALAVVPDWLQASLVETLCDYKTAAVFQHGWQHINHARRHGQKGACELGMHRGREAVLADLRAGRDVLRQAFGARFEPVVAPPWNRMDADLLPDLPGLGYRGVSAFGARNGLSQTQGFIINNCQCDPIDWKKGACFRGTVRTLDQIIEHLRARRCSTLDHDEATGLLTHHLDMDDATWHFTGRLLAFMSDHPVVRVLEPAEVFAS